jgi:hypothetical protein
VNGARKISNHRADAQSIAAVNAERLQLQRRQQNGQKKEN